MDKSTYERDITRQAMAALVVARRRREFPGAFFWKISGGGMQLRGMPDVGIIYIGMSIFIELKTATGKMSAIQRRRAREIVGGGGVVLLVRRAADVVRAVKEISGPIWQGIAGIYEVNYGQSGSECRIKTIFAGVAPFQREAD